MSSISQSSLASRLWQQNHNSNVRRHKMMAPFKKIPASATSIQVFDLVTFKFNVFPHASESYIAVRKFQITIRGFQV